MAQTALANDQCGSLLKACDIALESSRTLTMDQGKQILDMSKQTELQAQIIKDQDSRLANPIHDPVKVTAVAILVTVIAIGLSGHLK